MFVTIQNVWRGILIALLFLCPMRPIVTEENRLLIDDRQMGDYESTLGSEWRIVTDGVMGGVSKGRLSVEEMENRPCLRLRGDVSLENNGGFIQAALDLPHDSIPDISDYVGILIQVYGNGEQYNIHLRTHDMWLPWQSYRATFTATDQWQTLRLPFAAFEAYRTSKALDIRRLKRIGVVAIGREFEADLCLGRVALYR